MQFNRAKLKTAILYTCAHCDPSHLGAVKLHKVLYFADMLHYAHVGAPITGATYRKRPHGPTCDELLPTLSEMEKAGHINVREVDYFGYRKKEYTALDSPDAALFSESERALLDEVIEFVCRNNSAKTISDFSHNRAWEIAEFGETLPYNSVYLLYPTQASPEALEWGAQEAKKIETQRSQGNTLGRRPFRTLRESVLERL